MTLKTIVVSCDNIVYERFSLASFHNVKINSRHVKFLSFRSFGNLLTSFCTGIAVSGLMLRLKAKDSARILSLKRPSAGTRNGSAAIPSAFASKQHSLSVSQKIWSSKQSHRVSSGMVEILY